jgi:hypothetical protein
VMDCRPFYVTTERSNDLALISRNRLSGKHGRISLRSTGDGFIKTALLRGAGRELLRDPDTNIIFPTVVLRRGDAAWLLPDLPECHRVECRRFHCLNQRAVTNLSVSVGRTFRRRAGSTSLGVDREPLCYTCGTSVSVRGVSARRRRDPPATARAFDAALVTRETGAPQVTRWQAVARPLSRPTDE